MIGSRLMSSSRYWPAAIAAVGLVLGGASVGHARQGAGGGGAGGAGGAGAAGAGTAAPAGGAAGAGGQASGGLGGAAGAGTVSTPFGSFPGGNGGAGMVSTPFGSFPQGSTGFGNNGGTGFNSGFGFNGAPGAFNNVAGANPFAGANPGFNGGFNPFFGNNSGANTNFAFNPYSGYNPLLGNPAGISGFSGSPFGSNALLNNPFNAFGMGNSNTFGSNPLLNNPVNGQSGLNNGLGSNPLVSSPINAVAPGQTLNAINNPGLFNTTGNAAFSASPIGVATGQIVGPNGFPVNGFNTANGGFIDPIFANSTNANFANSGFGSSFASYGAGLVNSGMGSFYGGYPSVGFGAGFPYYGGYGGSPFGYTIGLSPYDQAMYKYQKYALNASRYNLNNARATAAYSAANFYNDLAAATASQYYKTSTGIKPYYNIATGSSHMTPAMRHRAAAQARSEMIPRDKLIDENGHVRWPASAPVSPSDLATARSQTEAAIGTVANEFAKDGRAAVRDVVNAQDKLRDYGSKALNHLKSDRPAEANGLATFLASLDYALTTMGNATHAVGPDRTTPDSAPKTGGSVLRDSLKSDKIDDSNRQPASPDAAPRSGGDVLKDTVKSQGSGR